MWGDVARDVGEAREHEFVSQDMFFKPILVKGATIMRHENTRKSAIKILRRIIENQPVSLQIQRELVDERKDISQTAAGWELNKELMEQVHKHRQEMKAVQENMKEVIQTKDEETKRELEAETKKLQAEMIRVQKESKKLASDYNEEKSRMEKRMEEISEASRKESERTAEEYNQRLSELQKKLSQTSSDVVSQRVELKSQIAKIQQSYHDGGGLGFFGRLGSALDGVFRLSR